MKQKATYQTIFGLVHSFNLDVYSKGSFPTRCRVTDRAYFLRLAVQPAQDTLNNQIA